MAAICDASIHCCAVRVTRLDQLGNPTAGPNNSYVTSNPLMVTVKPQVEAGQDKTLIGGCDCIIAEYRGYDKLKRFDLEFDIAVIEPGLLEMLTGAAAILSGGSPIGVWWPSQVTCQSPLQPNVCFEAWTDMWAGDHQESGGTYQYIHWIWPSTRWQIGDHSLQNDFLQPKLTGFTRSNPNWGLGIYGDQTEAAQAQGGFFYTNTRPTASCGYLSRNLT